MRRFEFTLDNGIAEICSRNDEAVDVDESYIENNFTTDDLGRFMEEFPKWIKGVRDSDPN